MICPMCGDEVERLTDPDTGATDLYCHCGWQEHRPVRTRDFILICHTGDLLGAYSRRDLRVLSCRMNTGATLVDGIPCELEAVEPSNEFSPFASQAVQEFNLEDLEE